MLPADRVRLRHMLDAGKEAIAFLHGQQRSALYKDRKLALALVRSIEVIGEAATHVTQPCQDTCPQIPWPEIPIYVSCQAAHDTSRGKSLTPFSSRLSY